MQAEVIAAGAALDSGGQAHVLELGSDSGGRSIEYPNHRNATAQAPTPVPDTPGAVIDLAGGARLTVNEQVREDGGITVTGVRLTVPGSDTEILLGYSTAASAVKMARRAHIENSASASSAAEAPISSTVAAR